jgi:hypothetical protein
MYAPPGSSLSGSNVTVNWLINNPRVLYRTLRTLVQQRLIGGLLLSGRIDLTGSGSIVFGVSEGIFPRKAAEKVAPGGDYPLTDDDDGIPAFAQTDKWGLSFEVPQELIARNRIDIVRKRMVKLAKMIQVAGLTFLKTTNMPAGVNVMVVDSTLLGTIATEALGGDGWMGDASNVNDIEVKVEPLPARDGKRVFGRKVAVPLVQEPGAGVKITGA